MHEPRAYYNEHDPYAAAWLERLIAAGEIAPGDVDTRDILDVRPADLDGYTQCHFFAGIGIWSRALREAGWPDGRPVWTGSCPCQPLSAAGAGLGFDDDRHLFPGWHWLIEQQRPETVFGEQVASALGLDWADLVQAAMEATDYVCGFVDTCAAGFRSFHIRQRLYFAAEDQRPADGGLGNSDRSVSNGGSRKAPGTQDQSCCGKEPADYGSVNAGRSPSGLANTDGGHTSTERQQRSGQQRQSAQDDRCGDADVAADPSDGYWRDADWLFCRDGKWRPVRPGSFPLAYESAARMGRLRAYGNAIDLAQATAFIRAYMDRNLGGTGTIAGDLFEWGMS